MLLNKIKKEKINFLIFNGDLIGGYTNSEKSNKIMMDKFLSTVKNLPFRYFVIPGNHDIWNNSSLKLFKKYFKNTYYSFNYGNSHFTFLNTDFPKEKRSISGRQYFWLKKDLIENKKIKFKFLFMHRPMYPVDATNKFTGLNYYKLRRNKLHNLFKTYGINYVIAGHEHLYDKRILDGITYYIIGGGGGKLATIPRGFYHYLLVKVYKNEVKFIVKKLDNYKYTEKDFFHKTKSWK